MRALNIEEAMRARRLLDDWLAGNGKPVTAAEAHGIDAVLRSPVGSRAAADLARVTWLLRDMVRMANQTETHPVTGDKVSYFIEKMEDARSNRGEVTVAARRDTWRAILNSALGSAALTNADRLDAVVSELMAITTRKPKERAA